MAANRFDFVVVHDLLAPTLATRFVSLAQITEDTACVVDSTVGDILITDDAE
jgi:hypothetical protein